MAKSDRPAESGLSQKGDAAQSDEGGLSPVADADETPDGIVEPDPRLEEEKSSLREKISALAKEKEILRQQINEARELNKSQDRERLIVQVLTDAGAKNLWALQRLSKSLGLFDVHNDGQDPKLVGFLNGEETAVDAVIAHLRDLAPEFFAKAGAVAGAKTPAAPLDLNQKIRAELRAIK